jgi:hypothetical protein
MFDDEQSVFICKIAGPICLLVATPLTAWLGYSVTQQDIAKGIPLRMQDTISIIAVVVLMLFGSLYVCKVGGWFDRFSNKD